MNNNVKTVGLLGPYGYGNLGDAAIQEGNIFQLKKSCPQVDFVGISMNPFDTERRHGIKCYCYDSTAFARHAWFRPGFLLAQIEKLVLFAGKVVVFSPVARAIHWRLRALRLKYVDWMHWYYVARKVRTLNTLIISGGGQLDESWGGPEVHPYNIFKWCSQARKFSVNIVFQSVGVGELSSPSTLKYFREALRMANYISYRDSGSYRLVKKKFGEDFGGLVVPDLAFGYPLNARDLDEQEFPDIRRIAIGPIPYCSEEIGSWSDRDADQYFRYLQKLSELCRLLVLGGYHLIFIVGDLSADKKAVSDTIDILKSALPEADDPVYSVFEINTVDDLFGSLSSVDLVVASRFHGVLLSLMARKPVLALSFERKIDQLMSEVDLVDYLEDIDHFDADEVSKKIEKLWQHRLNISKRLSDYVQKSRNSVIDQAQYLSSHLFLQ